MMRATILALLVLVGTQARAQVTEYTVDSTAGARPVTTTYGDWRTVPTIKALTDFMHGLALRDSVVKTEADPVFTGWRDNAAPTLPGLAPETGPQMLTIDAGTGAIRTQAIPAGGDGDTTAVLRLTHPTIPGMANADGGKFVQVDATGKLTNAAVTGFATAANLADSAKANANGTSAQKIAPTALDTMIVTVYEASDTTGVSVTTIEGDLLVITATGTWGNSASETRIILKYGTAVLQYCLIANGTSSTAQRKSFHLQGTVRPGAATATVTVSKGLGTFYGVPPCKIIVIRYRLG